MKSILLDTDIFLEILKGQNSVVQANAQHYLKQFNRYAVSVITVAEIARGIYRQERALVTLGNMLI